MRRPLRSDEARAIANLAIDLGDPGRMSKARRLHRSNAVGAVDVDAGVARASVVDPSGEVHEVEVAVVAPPADGNLPLPGDLLATCTCDDHGDTCVHGLASLLGIAEEIEANGRLLDLWAGSAAPAPTASYESPSGDAQSFFTGRWTPTPERVLLTPMRLGQPPVLVVDDVDAGPVVLDARIAIADGLSRYRARP